jgi:hypothetical protein
MIVSIDYNTVNLQSVFSQGTEHVEMLQETFSVNEVGVVIPSDGLLDVVFRLDQVVGFRVPVVAVTVVCFCVEVAVIGVVLVVVAVGLMDVTVLAFLVVVVVDGLAVEGVDFVVEVMGAFVVVRKVVGFFVVVGCFVVVDGLFVVVGCFVVVDGLFVVVGCFVVGFFVVVGCFVVVEVVVLLVDGLLVGGFVVCWASCYTSNSNFDN